MDGTPCRVSANGASMKPELRSELIEYLLLVLMLGAMVLLMVVGSSCGAQSTGPVAGDVSQGKIAGIESRIQEMSGELSLLRADVGVDVKLNAVASLLSQIELSALRIEARQTNTAGRDTNSTWALLAAILSSPACFIAYVLAKRTELYRRVTGAQRPGLTGTVGYTGPDLQGRHLEVENGVVVGDGERLQ